MALTAFSMSPAASVGRNMQSIIPTQGTNDSILLVSLLYSCIDLWLEWDTFSTCSRPIHRWLLMSYSCVILFRVAHVLGSRSAARIVAATSGGSTMTLAADFLLDLRQKGTVPRLLAAFTWLLAFPFFVFWTGLGTLWLYDVINNTPTCVPSTTHLWFSSLWLVLSYVWILVHAALATVAWLLERRVRRAEVDLRSIEDEDVVSRWGQVSQLSGYSALTNWPEAGLSPAEIRELPGVAVFEGRPEEGKLDAEHAECAICINSFKKGDSLRTLASCGHAFHRSCIDLWLLRRADCPLCKRGVRRGDCHA